MVKGLGLDVGAAGPKSPEASPVLKGKKVVKPFEFADGPRPALGERWRDNAPLKMEAGGPGKVKQNR